MRTTINLRDDLIEKAREMTGIEEKTALIHTALEALIEKLARERLIRLGGTDPTAKPPPRRRRTAQRKT